MQLRLFAVVVLLVGVPRASLAGGGPTNVLVLFNADAPDSFEVADHYALARSLPPGHMCGVTGVDPAASSIGVQNAIRSIRGALDACLMNLPHPDEVDYLVLARGLPYRVGMGEGYSTSLEAFLQIHHSVQTIGGVELAGEIPVKSSDNYAAFVPNPVFLTGPHGPDVFSLENTAAKAYTAAAQIVGGEPLPVTFHRADVQRSGLYDFSGNLFIVTRLDGFNFEDAHDLVDRGVASDGSFPEAEILCMKGADPARSARDPECQYAIENLAPAGFDAVFVSPHDPELSGHHVAAYFTGTANLKKGIADNTYAPGAIACNLTSLGAVPQNFTCDASGENCPEEEAQTSIARFVRAGVTGVHGAVAEPLNNCFPNAGTLLLYTLGYNLGESFFFNQPFLYWRNLTLGDPLATPYATRPEVELTLEDTLPRGGTITVEAHHPTGIARVELFLDGARVASVESEALTYHIDGAPGDSFQALAVATAQNAPVLRPEWANAGPTPLIDTRGWISSPVTLRAAAGPADASGTDALIEAASDNDGAVTSAAEVTDAGKSAGSGCGSNEAGKTGWPALIWGWLAIRTVRRRVGVAGTRERLAANSPRFR